MALKLTKCPANSGDQHLCHTLSTSSCSISAGDLYDASSCCLYLKTGVEERRR